MANDVAQLTALIIRDLARGTETSITDVALVDIQAAIRDYEGYRFHFNEREINLTLSATSTYLLSTWSAASSGVADVIEVDGVSVTINGNSQMMEEIDQERYRELAVNSSLTGYPTRYSVFNQAVYVYPTPNSTFIAQMRAHVRFTEVSGQSDTNGWTTDGRELIRCAALKYIYGRHLNQYDAAQMMQLAEQRALAQLQRRADAVSGHRLSAGSM